MADLRQCYVKRGAIHLLYPNDDGLTLCGLHYKGQWTLQATKFHRERPWYCMKCQVLSEAKKNG